MMFASSLVSLVICAIYFYFFERATKTGYCVYASVFVYMCVLFIGMVIQFAAGFYAGAIVLMIVIGITALFVYCVRHRIPFTEAMLHHTSIALKENWGVFAVAIVNSFIALLWSVFWFFTVISMSRMIIVDNGNYQGSGFVVFLLILSLYWTDEVIRNISFTTTSGAIASYYYQPGVTGVVLSALKRACTTSFGSIALGSFFVAMIQLMRSMANMTTNNQRGILQCIIMCCLSLIEQLFRYFNMYAYTQVAIYGKDFMTAAKDTMSLFEAKGFTMIINDDLTGMVVASGVILCAGVATLFAGMLTYMTNEGSFRGGDSDSAAIIAFLATFVCCLIVCAVILTQIQAAVCTTFVIWAEDPDALQANRPETFRHLEDAKRGVLALHQQDPNTAPVVPAPGPAGVPSGPAHPPPPPPGNVNPGSQYAVNNNPYAAYNQV